MSDLAHPDESPRSTSLMIALCLADGDVSGAELHLTELIAWLAFDKPKQIGTGRVRVLVVDDNLNVAHVGCALLGHLGHAAVAAKDAREALALSSTFYPDVVFVDVDVLGHDGRELIKKLRARSKRPYVVATSRFASPREQQCARIAGCDQMVAGTLDLSKIRKVLSALSPLAP